MTQSHHTNQEQGKQSKVQTQIPAPTVKASNNQQKIIEITRTCQTTGHKEGKAAYKYIPARKSDRGNIQNSQGHPDQIKTAFTERQGSNLLKYTRVQINASIRGCLTSLVPYGPNVPRQPG
jgi:hypothetical protein